MGFEPSSEELELAVKVFDFNGDGNVSYMEMIRFVKGEENVTAEARAALRAYMLAEVFQVKDGKDVEEAQKNDTDAVTKIMSADTPVAELEHDVHTLDGSHLQLQNAYNAWKMAPSLR